MMKINSFQRAILVASCGLTCIVSALLFAVAMVVAYVTEDGLIQQLINLESDRVYQFYQQNNRLPDPALSFVTFYKTTKTLPDVILAAKRKAPKVKEVFTDGDNHFHISSMTLHDGKSVTIVAEVSSLLIASKLSGDVFILVLIVFVFAIGLSFAFSYLIGMHSVKPIVSLAGEVESIEDKQGQVKFSQFPYEVGFLARSMENAFNNVHQALEREKNFTRDVSHELRTPLTVLKNTLVLIEQRGFSQVDADGLKSAGESMENIVQTLLALARRESLDTERLLLVSEIESAILKITNAGIGSDFDFDIGVPNEVAVIANKQLLQLVFFNIVANAVAHSARSALNIRWQDGTLVFENEMGKTQSSDGRPEDALSSGMYQGVYLINRLVDKMHWRLDVHERQGLYSLSISGLESLSL